MRPISALGFLLLLAACGARHGHGHGHASAPDLAPATEACPGPKDAIRVRVLDSPELHGDDPLAFVREPALHWVVFLRVVEVSRGELEAERLGILVHSPSRFASSVWGFGASPQRHPAELELQWTEELCLFEVTDIETPTPEPDPDQPFTISAPQVHSAIVQ